MGIQHDLAQRIVRADRVVDVDRVVPQKLSQVGHTRRVDAVLGFLDAQHGAVLHIHQHQDQGDVPQRAVRERTAVEPVVHPRYASPQRELISHVVRVDAQLRDVRIELPEPEQDLGLGVRISGSQGMERGRQVAAGGRDVGRRGSAVWRPHRARFEVEYPPARHLPLRGEHGRVVVGVRAADHRQRRSAYRRGPAPASAVAVELNAVLLRRYQRSASSDAQCHQFPELPGRVESDELLVGLELRVGQALVLHEKAVRRRLVPQPDPVGEKRRARSCRLAEVVLDLWRHHHVRAQFDPASGVPTEHQVERGVAAVAGAPHFGGRVGDVAFGQRAQEVDRVEQVALADAVVADEAGTRPEANVRFADALEVLDRQGYEHRRAIPVTLRVRVGRGMAA